MTGRAGDPEKDGGGTERPLYPRNRQDGEEEPPAQADIAMTAVYAGPVPARKKSLLARIGRLLGK